jgi:hypothetical protein
MKCACTILSSVACLPLSYFFTASHTRHDFRKYVTERRMCVVSLQLLSQTFLILRIIHGDIIKNASRYSCYVTIILVRFLENHEFTPFSKKIKYQI